MNRCTYALASTANRKIGPPPSTLTGPLRDLYIEQEKERHKLKMQVKLYHPARVGTPAVTSAKGKFLKEKD